MDPDDYTTSLLHEHVISLIEFVGLCESLRTEHPAIYRFFRLLFERHPEKERKCVSQIVDIAFRRFPKARPPLKYSDHQVWIIKDDGTQDTISWVSCVKQQTKPPEIALTTAMRVEVDDQIREFRNKHRGEPCQLCGTFDNLSVDHIVKFRTLKSDFFLLNPNPPVLFAKNNCAQERFRPEDEEYASKWRDYHREHARLRILCLPCNIMEG